MFLSFVLIFRLYLKGLEPPEIFIIGNTQGKFTITFPLVGHKQKCFRFNWKKLTNDMLKFKLVQYLQYNSRQ